MGRILSGMQASGNLTLGNYLGALKPWVKMQHEHETFFCVVDSHAITVPQDPKALYHNSLEAIAAYIAAGIDYKESAVFLQSHVKEHAELGWIMQCYTPIGWLKRMTQFKDKAGKNQDSVPTGLFTYPVLMAADIFLYDTTHVPVGDDQKQHVELARDIAISFNQRYGTECFVVPEPSIPPHGARVKSLRDGTKKMSKSDPSDMSRINLIDDADTIRDKMKKARTDTGVMPSVGEDLKERPEVQNLIEIYASLTGKTMQDVITQYEGKQFAPFKTDLGELIVEQVIPIGTRMKELLNDKAELDKI
ncbi:MAG TPA: tryptophan--tRNA ligase, partial [Alphaproteobacteria bacterium]